MKKLVFLGFLSLTFMMGCHPYGGGVIVEGGYAHRPLPPAHAPAYGVHRLHRYYYYPNAEIYFDVGRNMYFYLNSAGAWTFSVHLPVHLRSHLRHGYVEVEMENDRPYLRHKYYKNKYKRHQRYEWKYRNSPKYRNDPYRPRFRDDRVLRDGSNIRDRKYEDNKYRNERRYEKQKNLNERQYEKRKFRNEQKYEAREYRNERKKEAREYRNERRYEKKENKMRQKQEKYDDDDDKRGMKMKRNDLY